MKNKSLKSINRRSAITLLTCMGFTLSLHSGLMASPEMVQSELDKISKGSKKKDAEIFLDVPEIAENGNQVKIVFEIDSPMSEAEYVKTVYVFADGNPEPDVAKFNFTPAMGACGATTRMRLSKTQNVIVLAEMNNGVFAKADTKVKVTIGGCGG